MQLNLTSRLLYTLCSRSIFPSLAFHAVCLYSVYPIQLKHISNIRCHAQLAQKPMWNVSIFQLFFFAFTLVLFKMLQIIIYLYCHLLIAVEVQPD